MQQASITGTATSTALGADVWDLVKSRLSQQIAPQEFNNWVTDTHQHSIEDRVLKVSVPDGVTKQFLEQEYSSQIQAAVEELQLPLAAIVYVASEPGLDRAIAPAPRPTSPEPSFGPGIAKLNAKFRFESFVVGSCNQFAHAAALAVSQNPSRSYNPLFIYGGVGMGKTHLMHAVGRALLDQYPDTRVVYTSSERFMNEMIQCIRSNRMPQFQHHYRSADVLLVDDVQIIAGKERTQEEFFHTFNELFDHEKQIILTSDSPPQSISGLVERLRSRFECGLMVDIQPPDLETKMAILDKKAEQEGVLLPEEVRIFIATKTKSNVRELEGALIKLIAYSSVTKSPITIQMAQQALKYLTIVPERRVTIDTILRAVGDHFDMQPAQIKQKSNARQIAYPRQIAMYLIKELTHASLPEIGRYFSGKHHTTVLHSVQKIDRLRQTDPELNRLLHSLTETIQ